MDKPAALITWLSADPDATAGMEEWYSFQHLPERLQLPGFLSGRRFRGIERDRFGRRSYCALYEVDNLDVFDSPGYLALLAHPDPLTESMFRHFVDLRRLVCRVRYRVGNAMSGTVCTVMITPEYDLRDTFIEELARSVLPRLHAERQVLSAMLLEAVDDGSSIARECPIVVVLDLHADVDEREVVGSVLEPFGSQQSAPEHVGVYGLLAEMINR